MKFTVFFLCFYTSLVSGLAGYPVIERFLPLGTEEGLSNNSINSIVKDDQGFLWIGTENGLNRYDGYYIDNFFYDPEDSSGIGYKSISHILKDSEGKVWVLYKNDHLQKINDDLTFSTFFNGSYQDRHINFDNMVEDDQKRLWLISDSEGIFTFDLKTHTVEKLKINSGFDFSSITAIHRHYDQIWFSNSFGQIGIYEFSSKVVTSVDLNRYFGNAQNKISSIYFNQNLIFIGTLSNGLYVFNHDFELVKHFTRGPEPEGITSNIIKSIEVDESGRIWVSSSIRGVNIISENPLRVKQVLKEANDYSISGEGINCQYRDNLGNMWLGTYAAGLNLWLGSNQNFTHYNLKKEWKGENVPFIIVDDQGQIWVSNGGDLSSINPRLNKVVDYQKMPGDPMKIKEKKVRNLAIDSRGSLIYATRHHGLVIRDSSGKTEEIKIEKLAGNQIKMLSIAHMTIDKWDNILIASEIGLLVYNHYTGQTRRYDNSNEADLNIGENDINYIFVDDDNNYWLAASDRKIIFLDPQNQEYKHYQIELPEHYSIYQQFRNLIVLQDKIWIGTEGAGLIHMDRKSAKIRQFTLNDGLPNNDIQALQIDKNGILWASTNNGVFNFDPNTYQITKFDVSDGLQDKSFIVNSTWQSGSGVIYFGGYKGFNSFHPDSIIINNYIPPVRISEVVVQNLKGEPLVFKPQIENQVILNHQQKNIAFNFSSFNFKKSTNVHYAYMLEGLDEQWNYSTIYKNINYRNLPPGEFNFKIRAFMKDDMVEGTIASFPFRIKQSPWKSPFAYFSYAFIFFGLLYLSRKITIDRIHLKNDIKLKEVEATKAKEIDHLRSEFYTNISHEIKTPLSLIIAPLKKMFDENNFLLDNRRIQELKMVLKNAERIQKLINQIIDLTKMQTDGIVLNFHYEDIIKSSRELVDNFRFKAYQQGVELKISTFHQSCWGFYDNDVLEKIIFNLLSNALKHTPGNGHIWIRLHIQFDDHHHPQWFTMVIADDGDGMDKSVMKDIFNRYFHKQSRFSKDKSDGIGLSLINKLIEIHKGQIKVKSKPQQGTRVIFRLPLSSQALETSGIISEQKLVETSQEQIEPIAEIVQENKPLILIAEDDVDLLAYLVENLKNSYQVLAVNNGEAGYLKAVEKIPDLIISDLMMPKLTGNGFLDKIRKNKLTSHIPFIMLTAKSNVSSQIDSYGKGADDYINKPFNFLLLRSRIVNLLNSHERLRLKYESANGNGERKVYEDQNPFLKDFYRLIARRYQEVDFSIEQIETELNLSHVQLYRKLKAHTNQSANSLLRNYRLEQAKKLLTNGQYNISEVAYQVGFNDPAYFSRCFSKHEGLSPREFIEKHLQS